MTDEQREAELMKKKGNEQFVEKNLNVALDFYQKAVELGWSQSFFHLNHFMLRSNQSSFLFEFGCSLFGSEKVSKGTGIFGPTAFTHLFYLLKMPENQVR